MVFVVTTLLGLASAGELTIPASCASTAATGSTCCSALKTLCTTGSAVTCTLTTSGSGEVVSGLRMANCGFDGTVPDFSSMTSLVILELPENDWTSLPDFSTLNDMPYLKVLNFSYCTQLTDKTLPNLGTLHTNLEKLNLAGNSHTGALNTYKSWLATSGIKQLKLQGNMLSGGIPTELSQAVSLTELNLAGNPLTGSIPDVEFLDEVTVFNLSQCSLSGSVQSAALQKMYHLEVLDLSGNSFTDSPPPLGYPNYPQNFLREVHLNDNQFTGAIPGSFQNLPALEVLKLSHNSLTTRIPAALDALKNLRVLDVGHNEFYGSIPYRLYKLPLEEFNVENNKLTGGIPNVDISEDFLKLQKFDASGNKIGGGIPGSWPGLTELTYLDLANNSLTGTVPPSYAPTQNQQPLETLMLGGNPGLSCPVYNYSGYVTSGGTTDFASSYGTNGGQNCGATVETYPPTGSPLQTPGPTQYEEPKGGGLSGGWVFSIILVVFLVISGFIYWRWQVGKKGLLGKSSDEKYGQMHDDFESVGSGYAQNPTRRNPPMGNVVTSQDAERALYVGGDESAGSSGGGILAKARAAASRNKNKSGLSTQLVKPEPDEL